MHRTARSLLLTGLLATAAWPRTAPAQIPAAPTTGEPAFKLDGMTDQPFTVEVLDAHRTVANTLLVRLALTNRGTAPLRAQVDFADPATPAEDRKISGVYAIDTNGQTKYAVLRNERGSSICSLLEPGLQPGERRNLFIQLAAPPDTSSAISLFFPKAGRIPNVPIGLPASGEAVPTGASIGDPGQYPSPAAALPPAPQANVDERSTNISPNVVTDQLGSVPPPAARAAIGAVRDGNSVVPFAVEALDFKKQPDGAMKLRLAITNHSSGPLDADGQFNSGTTDAAHAKEISGVYVADPVTHATFQILRPTEVSALCSSISPALAPGERRVVEAQFAEPPVGVKTVYVYFPHASPIPDVPITR